MKEEKLQVLQEDIKLIRPLLSKATDAVLDQEISRYPILILHRQEIDVGIPLTDPEMVEGMWRVNISSLEEFVTKQLIEMAKVDNFIKIFKDPETHYCLFLIHDTNAQFIFVPR